MWGFTACEQHPPSPPPPTMLFPQPPLPLIWGMLGLVITEQMNLLTPKLDLWDGDISDVRQCFTHVHVCLLSLNYSASPSVENQLYPEEGLSWIPALRASDIHCTLRALAQYLHFSKQKNTRKSFFSFPFIIKVNWAPLQKKYINPYLKYQSRVMFLWDLKKK